MIMLKTHLIALPYALVRVPLSYLDAKLFRRLPENAELRIVFDQTVGGIDLWAGQLLGVEAISRNGLARVQNAGGRMAALGSGRRPAAQPAWPRNYADTRPSNLAVVERNKP
jgi:hypothetical protein